MLPECTPSALPRKNRLGIIADSAKIKIKKSDQLLTYADEHADEHADVHADEHADELSMHMSMHMSMFICMHMSMHT